jgi:hypothetical protein
MIYLLKEGQIIKLFGYPLKLLDEVKVSGYLPENINQLLEEYSIDNCNNNGSTTINDDEEDNDNLVNS